MQAIYNFRSPFTVKVHYFPITYSSLNSSIVLEFVAVEANWISNTLVLFTFNMGDQDHDSFFSSIMLKNIENQIPMAFDQVTPSKTMTLTTKSPPL